MAEIDPHQEEIIAEARSWIIRGIRAIREARGFTQTQVADKMGISFSRVSDLESGINDYKVSTMLRAAYALGVTAEALIRGCPDFVRGRAKKPESIVIVPFERLVQVLRDEGMTPKRADSVARGLLVDPLEQT